MLADEAGILIAEPITLRRERRGGAVNLWLAGILLEAARMVDDDIAATEVEAAARSAFGCERGLLERITEMGADRLTAFLDDLTRRAGPEDPLFQRYDNFFTPAAALSFPERLALPEGAAAGEDWLLQDHLVKRFQGVAFMIAAELIEAGLLTVEELNRAAVQAIGAGEGPFSMMNRLGIQESLQIVTERMEMSHRREINFPVPKRLIEQAQKNTPWPINNRLSGG